MPAVFFLFKEPITKNTTSENNTVKKQLGVTFKDALQGHPFWFMGIALIFAAGSISGLITNSVPMLIDKGFTLSEACLLYTSPSPRDRTRSRMPSSA